MLEYQSARMHTYSLGLQAIVSRTLAESNATPSQSPCFNLTPTDFAHVQEVIDSALVALKIAVKLSKTAGNILRFCSIRAFLHITSASIFLLKGLGLGVSPAKLREALGVLRQAITALKHSNPDDLHMGTRYATLLEMHLARLGENFVPSLKPPNVGSHSMRQPAAAHAVGINNGGQFDFLECIDAIDVDALGSDWLSLPLDTSLVPFGMDNFQGLQCLGDDTLDFLWNLGA